MNHVLSEHYFMARFIFFDNQHRDTLNNVGFRLRGNSSRYSKKKSFKISFNEYVDGRKYQLVKKINLNGEHNDPTMIREKLFYDLWKKSGLPERRTSFVRLYINHVYYGLYTNLEELDKEWLGRIYLKDDGNLYKCTYPADLVYHGDNQQTYKNIISTSETGGRAYDLQTNQEEDDYTGLVTLIDALSQPADSSFEAFIPHILHVDEFLKSLALDVATGNWDDYGYNKNNYYLYDNPFPGRFEFITFDPDNTMGVDWFGIDWATRNCLHWGNSSLQLPLSQKLLAVPSFFNIYKAYLDTIARYVIYPDSVFPRIDALKLLITPAAQADTYRTLDYGYTMADFNDGFIKTVDDHTPYGIKPFLTTRYQTILQQLSPAGFDEIPAATNKMIVFPNPAPENVNTVMIKAGSPINEGEIYDQNGRQLITFKENTNHEMLILVDISKLTSGIYIICIKSSGKIFVTKFIKE
ncbi:MAG: CotH kinase family protein [Bacteroidetes bacterium]|nr:CotH kinase family protein [Bacteroidota bacterium]